MHCNRYLQNRRTTESCCHAGTGGKAGEYLEPGRSRGQAHDGAPGGLGLPAQRGVHAVVAVRGDLAHGELRQKGHAPGKPRCPAWRLSHNH